MHRLDDAANALFALNAARTAAGHPRLLPGEAPEEEIADLIANLLHLARETGHDPEETHQRGWSYFEGDAEGEEHSTPAPGAEGYHGTPVALARGARLRPGPHLHHVFADESPTLAAGYGRTKAGRIGYPVHVYRVRFGDDAERDEGGYLYGATATVLEEVDPATAPDLRPATATAS